MITLFSNNVVLQPQLGQHTAANDLWEGVIAFKASCGCLFSSGTATQGLWKVHCCWSKGAFWKVSLKLWIWKHGRLVSSHIPVVWGRKKPVFDKNVASFSHSFLHFFMGLSGGTSKVWGRKGEAGKEMLGVSWGTSCQHWSCVPNSPSSFGHFRVCVTFLRIPSKQLGCTSLPCCLFYDLVTST